MVHPREGPHSQECRPAGPAALRSQSGIAEMSTAARPMTAEEYVRITPSDVPTELVRGEIVEMNRPGFRHGRTCHRASLLIGNFVDAHDLGHVLTNDSSVITERNPDTVRGPDVWFVGYDKLPKDAEEPDGYLEIVPDLVFEVLSPFRGAVSFQSSCRRTGEGGGVSRCRRSGRVCARSLEQDSPSVLPGGSRRDPDGGG